MPAEFVVVLLAVVGALAFARLRPSTSRRLFEVVRDTRQVVGAVVALAIALVLIGSGYLPYMLLGAAFVAYGTLLFVYEEPHREVLDRL